MTQDEARLLLDEFRVSIDDIDKRIVELINERTRVVEEIGRIKREAQLPVYEPKREEQVFANITSANQGPIPSDSVRRIFERIIDEMRTLQRRKISPHPEDPKC
jgi:chorismate mutase-like protein